MAKRQIIALWVLASLWAVSAFIWYICDSYAWGFTQFIQSAVVGGIFATLTYVSLAKKNTPDSRNKELMDRLEQLGKSNQYIDGLEVIDKLEVTTKLPQKKIDDLVKVFSEGSITELYQTCHKLIEQKEFIKAVELAYEVSVYGLPEGISNKYLLEVKASFGGSESGITLPQIRNTFDEVKNKFLAENASEKLNNVLVMLNHLLVTKFLHKFLNEKDCSGENGVPQNVI